VPAAVRGLDVPLEEGGHRPMIRDAAQDLFR